MRKHSPKPASRNRLRIIAGTWRGRTVSFLDSEGLRPTPDRVRETLFNWLQNEINGARCLDLFAGSGALGFEALSRGARSLTCLESAGEVCRQLRENSERLQAGEIEIIQRDALAWLQAGVFEEKYDIAFIDPPFSSGLLEESCAQLEASRCLSPGANIYLEWGRAPSGLDLPLSWQAVREKQAGQVYYGLWKRQAPDSR